MDAVENLFRAFPDPKSFEDELLEARRQGRGRLDLAYEKFNTHLQPFLELVNRPGVASVDPDLAFLKANAQQAIAGDDLDALRHFRQQLLRLSLWKPEIPDDGSAKAKQLRYHRWIAQGRKIAECPFLPTTTDSKDSSSLAYLPAHVMNPQSCAACGSGNTFACTGCLVTLDSEHVIFKTVYCSKVCQKADWGQHKAVCTPRKMIGRAAILLRHLFIIFQGLNYTTPVSRVIEKNGVTYRFVSDYLESAFQGQTVPHPFPHELVSSEDAFRAAITAHDCTEAYSTFKCIVDFFLNPICKRIFELDVFACNVHRPTLTINPQTTICNMMTGHFVLQDQLSSEESVAIDLAGAQFGWQEPVSPWKAWVDHRSYGPVSHLGHNYISNRKNEAADAMGTAGYFSKVEEFRRKQVNNMMVAIIDTINKQQPGTSASVTKLLRDRNFEDLEDQVVKASRHAMEAGLSQLAASKTMRMYWGADWVRNAAETKEQSQVLEKVWLSSEEYQRSKHDVGLLKTLWTRACEKKKVAKDARKRGLKLVGGDKVDSSDDEDASKEVASSDDTMAEAAWLSRFQKVILADGQGTPTLYRSRGMAPETRTTQALAEQLRRMREREP
ncbi:zinc finger MYND-type [Apiospora aurea]|uniref:Zinc finger MYND-type n=1 Tax=Apiospora aurea TaxID=335848 RepID=A0ABR1PWN4_9PEZI